MIIAMNATTLQAYALEKGINFEWNTASNAEKAELAMKMFMDRTSQYAGNFAKESETTWSGSIGAMKASYQDLMANIMLGNDIAPSLEALGGTIKTFTVNNLMPAIANILQGLPTALVTMLTGVGPEVAMAAANLIAQLGQGVVQSVPKMADSAGKLMDNFILFLNAKMPALLNRGVFVVTNIVNGILSGLPKLIVAGSNMVTKFTTGIMQFLPKVMQAGVNLILKLVQGIIKNLPQIASAALSAITKFISAIGKNLPRIIQSGIEIIAKLAAGLIKAIPELVSKIPKIVRAITTEISSVDWWGIGKNIIDGIAKGLANAGHMLWDAVK